MNKLTREDRQSNHKKNNKWMKSDYSKCDEVIRMWRECHFTVQRKPCTNKQVKQMSTIDDERNKNMMLVYYF